MKQYENDDNFDRRSRHKKSKCHSARKRILGFFTICSCLAVMIIMVCQLGNIHKNNAIKQPFHLSDSADNGASDTDETNTDETSWCLILVNKWNYIPDDYKVELTQLSNGQSIDERIYPALQKMFDSARSDNVYPVVASGYRTTEQQQSLMDDKINEYEIEGYSPDEAKAKAEAWVAIPGTSEHQLGIAVDINADGIHSAGYEVYEWLDKNAYKFGFICRYPEDKTDITGVINEPWHYRYVGIEAATEIHNQGVCLEEYLNKTN